MDPLQQKALNAIEPFVLLSKSAISPRAAADLISQATSAPNTYVFAELLQTPNIQALRTASADYAPYLTLLEIFAWGTWADYTSTPNLPPLTDPQAQKLRLLTLLTLATNPASLTYPSLLSALSLPTPVALENLVITAIYASLLTGTLNPLAQRVDLTSVAPLRDLAPGSVPGLITVLEDWNERCKNVLWELESQIADVRLKAKERRVRGREREQIFEGLVEEKIKGKREAEGTGAMEVDVERGDGRGAKRGGRFGGFGLGRSGG